jgi:two-component system NtrC family sensor kinase
VLRKYLRRIQDEAFRCKGITDKLLSYSRLGDAEKQDTDLSVVITDAIELVRTVSSYRGKRIEFQPRGPLVIRVVPHEIKQVALNLITNALDSLDHNGVVRLELHRVGQMAELIVQDNGCGLTEEVKKHLFEPFFTRRRSGQGTGLGLSITYRIVQDHGGTISVTSDGPGRGSLFRITLPLNHHEERLEKLQAA